MWSDLPSAIGDGWLIAALALFVSLLLPLLRWVASRWRERYDAKDAECERLKVENKVLKDEAVKRTEEKTSLQIENMLLQTKLELCENNLENWESGRWEKRK